MGKEWTFLTRRASVGVVMSSDVGSNTTSEVDGTSLTGGIKVPDGTCVSIGGLRTFGGTSEVVEVNVNLGNSGELFSYVFKRVVEVMTSGGERVEIGVLLVVSRDSGRSSDGVYKSVGRDELVVGGIHPHGQGSTSASRGDGGEWDGFVEKLCISLHDVGDTREPVVDGFVCVHYAKKVSPGGERGCTVSGVKPSGRESDIAESSSGDVQLSESVGNAVASVGAIHVVTGGVVSGGIDRKD